MSFGGQSNNWQRGNVNQLSSFQPQQQMPMFLQQGPPQQNNMNFGAWPNSGNSVSYPQPRASGLNPVAFQQNQTNAGGNNANQSQHYNSIGTVTKINSDFGLVNDEVFFYRNVCKGHAPKLGDRVLFEATFSSTGQFKWNATRIQLMPQQTHQPQPLMGNTNSGGKGSSGYNAVPPPNNYQRGQQMQRHGSPPRRFSPARDRHGRGGGGGGGAGGGGGGGDRDRRDREKNHRSRDRDDDEHERKRRREDRSRERMNAAGNARNNAARGKADREKDRNDRADSKHREHSNERKDRERERDREREKDRNERAVDRVERSPYRPTAKGRRTRAIRRYLVRIPKFILSYKTADVQELRQRYGTLYIPSEFFHANIKWSETFTPDNPFSLRRPCQFHIMHKIVDSPHEQATDELEPPDANYAYTAKVMLLACPPISELYKSCQEDDENQQQTGHPSRLISFLVGTRGSKNLVAIGGPWSPSLDGPNPDKDPAVLIRTAIRTCKALTGIDLSNCTQWYRFMELFYQRNDDKHKNKDAPPRVETVVIYLPDIHSCMPSINEWQTLTQTYKAAAEQAIIRKSAAIKNSSSSSSSTAANNNTKADEAEATTTTKTATTTADGEMSLANSKNTESAQQQQQQDGIADADAGANADIDTIVLIDDADDVDTTNNADSSTTTSATTDSAQQGNATTGTETATQNESAQETVADGDDNHLNEKMATDDGPQATSYDKLDLKTMKLIEIRNELTARNLPAKGSRNMLVARLSKALNAEKSEAQSAQKSAEKSGANKTEDQEATEGEGDAEENREEKTGDDNEEHEDWADVIDVDMSDIVILDEYDSSKNPEESNKELDEKEKNQLIRRYTLPAEPHIIVHPNKLAKNGKFDCSVISLPVLLDYRPGDTNRQHLFEVALFAEVFNEMLMRDFGFNIYKEIYLNKINANGTNETATGEAKDNDDASNSKKDENNAQDEDEKSKDNADGKSNADEHSEKSGRERRAAKRSVDEEPEDDSKSVKSAADRKHRSNNASGRDKERERDDGTSDKKMVLVKPQLLLSFVYFDVSHCGYIFEKDLEDLFYILGLSLSRAQIRKVLGEQSVWQAFYYRKLVYKEDSLENPPKIEEEEDLTNEELKKIAVGNQQYANIFRAMNGAAIEAGDSNGDKAEGLVNYNGAVVHVGKLVEQIKRTEKNFADLDRLYNDLRKQHTDLQKDHSKSTNKIKDLQSEVKSLTRKLDETDQDLFSVNRKFRDQQSTLLSIYNRVSPYFAREKDKEKEKDKDHKSESARDKDADKDKEKEKDKDKEKKEEKEKEKEKEKDKDKEKKEEKEKDKNKEKEKEKEKDKSKDVKTNKDKDKTHKDTVKVDEKSKKNGEKDKNSAPVNSEDKNADEVDVKMDE